MNRRARPQGLALLDSLLALLLLSSGCLVLLAHYARVEQDVSASLLHSQQVLLRAGRVPHAKLAASCPAVAPPQQVLP